MYVKMLQFNEIGGNATFPPFLTNQPPLMEIGIMAKAIIPWQVDHIIPLAAHNFISSGGIDFKRAWALKNLQPLWAYDNQSKGCSLDKPFQPSLAFGGAM